MVETIRSDAFEFCYALTGLLFASGSRMSRIAESGLDCCFGLRSIILPTGLKHLEKYAFDWPSIEYMGIETGNRHFSISGSYLLDFAGISIVGHIGVATQLDIPSAIQELCDGCFYRQKLLRSVSFQQESRLRRIGDNAFSETPVTFIGIPPSVEIIGLECFNECRELSAIVFQSNSSLSVIGERAFRWCSSLKIVFMPPGLETIAGPHFAPYAERAFIGIFQIDEADSSENAD
jgi:hypothetical protein